MTSLMVSQTILLKGYVLKKIPIYKLLTFYVFRSLGLSSLFMKITIFCIYLIKNIIKIFVLSLIFILIYFFKVDCNTFVALPKLVDYLLDKSPPHKSYIGVAKYAFL